MFKPKLKPLTKEISEKTKPKLKQIYKILLAIGVVFIMACVIFLIVKIVSSDPESNASVTDTFDDETKIYSKTHLVVSGGQVKLTNACNGETTVQDASSTVYSIVAIGNQCWMAENLNYDNGCSSNGWVNESDTGWCGYYNGSSTDDTYGLLYQWSAAMNGTTTEGAQGICPAGWHLPTHNEWTDLERQICSDIGNSSCDTTFPYNTSTTGYLGDGEGPAMAASTTLWTDGLLDSDPDFATSGLDVFPAGYRNYLNGGYNGRSSSSYSWSSTESGTNAWIRYLYYNNAGVYRVSNDKANGFSVRCLRQ